MELCPLTRWFSEGYPASWCVPLACWWARGEGAHWGLWLPQRGVQVCEVMSVTGYMSRRAAACLWLPHVCSRSCHAVSSGTVWGEPPCPASGLNYSGGVWLKLAELWLAFPAKPAAVDGRPLFPPVMQPSVLGSLSPDGCSGP